VTSTHPGHPPRVSRSAITPLEEFPSPAAVPRHRGRCPLDVAARSADPDAPSPPIPRDR
jgi:hypothetical protein